MPWFQILSLMYVVHLPSLNCLSCIRFLVWNIGFRNFIFHSRGLNCLGSTYGAIFEYWLKWLLRYFEFLVTGMIFMVIAVTRCKLTAIITITISICSANPTMSYAAKNTNSLTFKHCFDYKRTLGVFFH